MDMVKFKKAIFIIVFLLMMVFPNYVLVSNAEENIADETVEENEIIGLGDEQLKKDLQISNLIMTVESVATVLMIVGLAISIFFSTKKSTITINSNGLKITKSKRIIRLIGIAMFILSTAAIIYVEIMKSQVPTTIM